MDTPQKKDTDNIVINKEKSKFKPDLNKFRMHGKRSNSEADDFIFVRKIIRNSTEPIVPLMAGVTKADAKYSIDLSINGFGERYLTVLEYVVSGSGYIHYNKMVRNVHAGYFYILHPIFTGHYHSDPQDPFVKKWVNIKGRILPALLKAYGWSEQATIFKNCPKAEYYMDQIHDILAQYNDENPDEDERKIVHILVDLFDYLSHNRQDSHLGNKPNDSVNIEKITTYINGNIAYGKITVETLSQVFFISRRSLSRMFKKELGISPGNYLTSKKVEIAQKMLAENYSVEEVAEILSFSSAEYLRKVFNSVCGVSPQKWKKNYLKK